LRVATSPTELALLPIAAADVPCATELAQRTGLPLLAVGNPETCTEAQTVLVIDGQRRSLQRTGKRAPGPVTVDFGSAGMRHRRRSGHMELISKAVGQDKKRQLLILDATAGLGTDAFVLADLGCEVLLCERQPVIAELLRSGLQVAAGSPDHWLLDTVARMQLHAGDARLLAPSRLREVEVIYLDPMFPPRGKSAAVKKEMALFQQLLERDTDEQDAVALLHWALQQSVARVVVKRPTRAPSLAALPPSHSISGKAVRYDVYVRRALR
jgi:16S rRNA (guanine1516-N2)-methyltransferase